MWPRMVSLADVGPVFRYRGSVGFRDARHGIASKDQVIWHIRASTEVEKDLCHPCRSKPSNLGQPCRPTVLLMDPLISAWLPIY